MIVGNSWWCGCAWRGCKKLWQRREGGNQLVVWTGEKWFWECDVGGGEEREPEAVNYGWSRRILQWEKCCERQWSWQQERRLWLQWCTFVECCWRRACWQREWRLWLHECAFVGAPLASVEQKCRCSQGQQCRCGYGWRG